MARLRCDISAESMASFDPKGAPRNRPRILADETDHPERKICGTHHRGGVEAGAVAGSGSQNSAQGGFGEGGFGGALAGGYDDDGGVDRRASGDGHARLLEPSIVSPEEAERGVNNIKN